MDHSKDQPLCLVFGLQGLQNILVTPFKEVCVVTKFKVNNMFCVQDAAGDACFEVQSIGTVDGSEIPSNHGLDVFETL